MKEKCFVMMPFTTPAKYQDVDHFEKIYDQIFVPAIRKAGYEPHRVDQDKICDSIIGKIFESVRTCPMALCDLSNRNPNVLYELGLRQAYNMPVVLVQDDITERIFDVSGLSTITYNNHRLIENVEDAIEAISEAIIQTKEGKEKTLATIVKAQSADYASVSVDTNDNMEILLKTILSDIKELKEERIYNDKKSLYNYVLENQSDIVSVIYDLKNGITDKEVNRVIGKFEPYIKFVERRGNKLLVEISNCSQEKAWLICKEMRQMLE